MGIGAIGSDAGYYGYGVTGKRSGVKEQNSFFSTIGSATKETTSSSNGKTIGIMTVGSNGYLAKYADSSTPADPIIKVGDYEVRINDVNPNNATQLEMFAWTSYMEDSGQIEKQGMSTYSKMKSFAVQSQLDGVCSGIYDGGSNEKDFWNKKQNWSAIIENAKNTFAGMKETYSQSLECGKLLSYFEKWMVEMPNKKAGHEENTLFEKIEKKRDLDIPTKGSFRPDSSKEVMDAWDKTLEETGIDPFPMNKISTALVISVENGIQGLSSTFLGDSIASAKNIVEQIIERLENPLDPSDVTEFSNNEKIFYKRFLENLRLAV